MAGKVSQRPLTLEVRVRSWSSPCDICGGQNILVSTSGPENVQSAE